MADPMIPDRLLNAFKGRTLLGLDEAAAALEISTRTLRDEVTAGLISFRPCGGGSRRVRRRFGLDDCLEWLERKRKAECPSIAPVTPKGTSRARSSTTTSSSQVYDFTARRAKLRSEKRLPTNA